MSQYDFLENEIPYDKLEKLGIDQKSLLSMPRDVIEPLMAGRITPLLLTHYKAANGKMVSIPMKLQLQRDKEENVMLMTYQLRKRMERGRVRISNQEAIRLCDGEVLRKEVSENGKRQRMYVQLDHDTNSLMLRSTSSVWIAERLREMEKIKDIELGTNQKQAAMEGKPVELAVGEQKVTVGVDLREPQGFKVVKGDMQEWERQNKMRYDYEHEDFMGYVLTDENRWQYQKLGERISQKEERKNTLRKEEERSHRLRL